MNLLASYPIIIPISDGGIDDIRIEVVLATLIVLNVIGLTSLFIAFIINNLRNKNNNGRKESLHQTLDNFFLLYLLFGLSVGMDIFFAIMFSISFVSTLL